jgi:hypothetical protein
MELKRRKKLSQEEIDRFYGWLREYPQYRELIRQRVSDEQKRRRKLQERFDTRERALWKRYHPNEPWPGRMGQLQHDKLGREVEGCG